MTLKVTDLSMPSRVDGRDERTYRKGEPFLCKECNKVWQHLRDYESMPDYLRDFPKYGCSVRVCNNCI